MTSVDLVERSCLESSSGFRNVLAGNGELCFASKTLNGRQCGFGSENFDRGLLIGSDKRSAKASPGAGRAGAQQGEAARRRARPASGSRAVEILRTRVRESQPPRHAGNCAGSPFFSEIATSTQTC